MMKETATDPFGAGNCVVYFGRRWILGNIGNIFPNTLDESLAGKLRGEETGCVGDWQGKDLSFLSVNGLAS